MLPPNVIWARFDRCLEEREGNAEISECGHASLQNEQDRRLPLETDAGSESSTREIRRILFETYGGSSCASIVRYSVLRFHAYHVLCFDFKNARMNRIPPAMAGPHAMM